MELENILLSEVSQIQKAKGHMFSLLCGIELIQIQKYYEIQIMQRELTYKRGRVKEGS
jgi:hypothetical protein